MLRQASERLADGSTLDRSFLADLDTWLAQLPIPADAELIVSEASEELAPLSKRFFTVTTMRELTAAHLLAQWPSDSASALKSLLGSLNYIKGPCD